ncbi:MAG: hypothetical protein JW839_06000, partial [Candidatus Lokiarchaeota archaeon]|nr:hypothetical protein [Candidatus Lokiarchaeota archaeon]
MFVAATALLLAVASFLPGSWWTRSPAAMVAGTDIVASNGEPHYCLDWNRTWGGTVSDWGCGVAVAADGVYLAGFTDSVGEGGYDAFLAKYDAAGTQQWNRTWGGASDDDGARLAVAADGVYLAGFTDSFGEGSSDAFLAKYDAA